MLGVKTLWSVHIAGIKCEASIRLKYAANTPMCTRTHVHTLTHVHIHRTMHTQAGIKPQIDGFNHRILLLGEILKVSRPSPHVKYNHSPEKKKSWSNVTQQKQGHQGSHQVYSQQMA